jgi:hypothetical protein
VSDFDRNLQRDNNQNALWSYWILKQ